MSICVVSVYADSTYNNIGLFLLKAVTNIYVDQWSIIIKKYCTIETIMFFDQMSFSVEK